MTNSLHIIHGLPKFSTHHWAGAEASVAAVAPWLKTMGYSSEVISLSLPGDQLKETVHGLPVRRFAPSRVARPTLDRQLKGAAGFSPGAVRHMATSKADLAHFHTHNRFITSLAHTARLKHIPYILSVHSLYIPDKRPLFGLSVLSAESIFRGADHIVCVSPRDFETLSGTYGDSRVSLVPNGVDPIFAKGNRAAGRAAVRAADDEILLVQVGRICALKNQAYAIDMMQMLEKTSPGRARLAIAGDVSEQDYDATIRSAATRNPKLLDRILFLGAVSPASEDLADLFSAADVVMLPSLHEAQPLVLNEAWAAQRPVAVIQGGGLEDVVNHSGLGCVLPASPDHRAAKMLIEVSRASQGGATEELWANYQPRLWSDVANDLANIYSSVKTR